MVNFVLALFMCQLTATGNDIILAELQKISNAYSPKEIISTTVSLEYDKNIHQDRDPVERSSMDMVLYREFQYFAAMDMVVIVESGQRLEMNMEEKLMFLSPAVEHQQMAIASLSRFKEILKSPKMIGTIKQYSADENILEVKDETGEIVLLKLIYNKYTYLPSAYEELFFELDESTYEVVMSSVKVHYNNTNIISPEAMSPSWRISNYVKKSGGEFVPLKEFQHFQFFAEN